jgi:hypothetical protein
MISRLRTREVWIVAGNMLDRSIVENAIRNDQVDNRLWQFLIHWEGLRTACARAGALVLQRLESSFASRTARFGQHTKGVVDRSRKLMKDKLRHETYAGKVNEVLSIGCSLLYRHFRFFDQPLAFVRQGIDVLA